MYGDLNYPYTCPEIDRELENLEGLLADALENVLSDACGLLTSELRTSLSRDYAKTFFSTVCGPFELVRSTNEGLRKAADARIRQLEGDLASTQADLEEVRRALREAEETIHELENQI